MDIDILIPDNLPLSTMDFIIVVKMLKVYTCLKRKANIPIVIVEFIKVVIKMETMVEVDLGLNIPATLTLEIMDQELMWMGEVDIGLRPSTISPITHVAVVDCWVSNFILFPLKIILTRMI